MPFHTWFSFVAATVILLLIPGPTVLQCVGDALANKQHQSWATVLGVGVGDAVAMSLSLLGAGALLSASAKAFALMKTVGGVYLIYLGIKAIAATRRHSDKDVDEPARRQPESALHRFSKASTITMLNPKSILFFVAFVPQFVAAAKSFAPQATLLLITFVTLAMLNAWAYMLLATVLSRRLQGRRAQRRVSYLSGGVLCGAGALTLALKRR